MALTTLSLLDISDFANGLAFNGAKARLLLVYCSSRMLFFIHSLIF
jgi:hypothetical protein